MSFLSSPCAAAICRNADCAHATAQHPTTGRWFITMGHCQFNSRANNGRGYASQAAALRAIRTTLARAAR